MLSPSLLSCDFTQLAKECQELEAAGLSWLHLDVMDGVFVPNLTFGPPLIKALRAKTKLFFDVHMMVEAPASYLEDLVASGADLVVIHAEASVHLQRTLAAIRSSGLKAGLALNPGTDLSVVRWLLDDLDLLLLMGVNPGFSGQSFLPRTVDKVREARAMLTKFGKEDVVLAEDGGVDPKTAKLLYEAGADVLVSGSSFFSVKPYSESLARFAEPLEHRPALQLAQTWRSRRTQEQ